MRRLKNTGRPIDIDAQLPALEACLRDVDGLVAAYLYGSYGTPDQTPLSDVDLGLVFAPGREPSFDDQLDIVGRVIGATHEDDVSVTVLNRMPAIFQFRVLETGRLLVCTDPEALADFMSEVFSRHADFMIDHQRFLEEYDAALIERYGDG